MGMFWSWTPISTCSRWSADRRRSFRKSDSSPWRPFLRGPVLADEERRDLDHQHFAARPIHPEVRFPLPSLLVAHVRLDLAKQVMDMQLVQRAGELGEVLELEGAARIPSWVYATPKEDRKKYLFRSAALS
jgi:hypothetical protein